AERNSPLCGSEAVVTSRSTAETRTGPSSTLAARSQPSTSTRTRSSAWLARRRIRSASPCPDTASPGSRTFTAAAVSERWSFRADATSDGSVDRHRGGGDARLGDTQPALACRLPELAELCPVGDHIDLRDQSVGDDEADDRDRRFMRDDDHAGVAVDDRGPRVGCEGAAALEDLRRDQ